MEFNELLKEDFPPVKWIIPDIIPQGFTIFAGDPKIGKSYFLMQTVISGALGMPFCQGAPATKAMSSLCFLLDDPVRRIWERSHDYANNVDVPIGSIDFCYKWPAKKDVMKDFQYVIENHPAHLIVIDVLVSIWESKSSNGNIYNDDFNQVKRIKDMIDANGKSLLVTHHTNQGTHTDPFNQIQGSQGLPGAADALLVISNMKKDGSATLHVKGNDVGRKDINVKFVEDTKRWRMAFEYEVLGPELMRLYDYAATVKDFTAEDYARVSGKTFDNCRKLINRLFKKRGLDKLRNEKGSMVRGSYTFKKTELEKGEKNESEEIIS